MGNIRPETEKNIILHWIQRKNFVARSDFFLLWKLRNVNVSTAESSKLDRVNQHPDSRIPQSEPLHLVNWSVCREYKPRGVISIASLSLYSLRGITRQQTLRGIRNFNGQKWSVEKSMVSQHPCSYRISYDLSTSSQCYSQTLYAGLRNEVAWLNYIM